MGSFLRKCFVSKQVIREGEEVVLIPVYNSQSHDLIKLSKEKDFEVPAISSHLCYPDAYWTPFGYVLEAKALDCGHYDLVASDFNHASLLLFLKELYVDSFKTHQGKNCYHDLEFDFESFFKNHPEAIAFFKQEDYNDLKELSKIDIKKTFSSFEMMQDSFIAGRVFVTGRKSYPAMTSFAVCSKKAYEYCLQQAKVENVNRDVYNKIEEFKPFERPINHAFKLFPNEFYNVFNYYRGDGMAISYSQYIEMILKSCEEIASKENLLKLKEKSFGSIFDFEKFQEYMLFLEIPYIPFFGASQDYSNDSGRKYFELLKHIQKGLDDE